MIRLKSLSTKQFASLLILLCFIFTGFESAAQKPDGEKLFKANCSSCHKPDQKLIGPALKGARERWGNDEKVVKWIQNPPAYLKTGDAYATKLVAEYANAGVMTPQAVTAEEALAILEYADVYVPPVADKGPKGPEGPVVKKETNWTYIWLGLGVLFLVLIGILAPVRRNLQGSAKAKAGHIVHPEDQTFWQETKNWMYSHKKYMFVLGFVVFLMTFLAGWYWLKGIGVYDGYAPEQPIKFSHKLHAGDNKIACQYCHSGVEKSRHANIPSANVCMNCHKYIQQGPNTGKEEIAKIYAALDYNPEKGTYGPNPKPIKWVRVHNLPDLAYFNHSQHVKVGGVECQTCHGPVQEMEVLKQNSELTMGWCVNCHRETEVNTQGNEYYTELKAKFNALHPGEKFTVEQIGGLECAKCHY